MCQVQLFKQMLFAFIIVLKYVNFLFQIITYRKCQKQPSRGVLRKMCSENMLQGYRRAPTPKWDFNKVALQSNFN